MIAEFCASVVEGFVAPRASVRRLRETQQGLQAALLMVALGYLITAIFMLLLDAPRADGAWIVQRSIDAVLATGLFFFMSGLIFVLGRAVGGTGSRQETYLVVGWHGLVTSLMTPVWVLVLPDIMLGMAAATGETPPQEAPGGSLLIGFTLAAAWFWLLASYVAELHRFASTWSVLGVVVGVPVGAMLVMAILTGAGSA